MRIRERYWFILTVSALICMFLSFSLLQREPPEPIVNGQPLSYWLDQYRLCHFEDGSPEESKKIESALFVMDDRCIQALTRELNRKPSWLVRKLNDTTERWAHFQRPFRETPDRRAMAALVLGQMGARATNAIPALDAMRHVASSAGSESWVSPGGAAITALVYLRHDAVEACATNALHLSNPHCWCYRDAIICLGTNAAPAVPIFVKAIEMPVDEESKQYSALALGIIHSRPDLSLPPLTQMLADMNPQSRSEAAHALSLFGSAAKPAWNNLTPLLNDPNGAVRRHATDALLKIDPVSAQKLGIDPIP